MLTHPSKRKRTPTEIIAGGLRGIFAGVFGSGSPQSQLSAPGEVGGQQGNFYTMHEGDLFTPGTGNWVLDPSLESQLATMWGHAFLRRPNTFNPVQPPQVMAQPNVVTVGVGALVGGQFVLQPLQNVAPEQGGL